jgi:hypothetical protein
MIVIHNVETNQITQRELNANELAELQSDQAQETLRLQAQATKAAEKAALLSKLGITADEAKLLLS